MQSLSIVTPVQGSGMQVQFPLHVAVNIKSMHNPWLQCTDISSTDKDWVAHSQPRYAKLLEELIPCSVNPNVHYDFAMDYSANYEMGNG